MALRWKAFAPNTILKAVEIQDITDNGVVQLDTAADLADADLVNANATYVTAEHKIYQRVASGVGADKWQVFSSGIGAAAISSPAPSGRYTDVDGTWDYYEFTASGSLTLDRGGFADVLVVGGGGGGGIAPSAGGAGGGAGAHLYATDAYLPAGSLTVTIGAGGAAYTSVQGEGRLGNNGGASSIGNYYAPGGGGAGTKTVAGSDRLLRYSHAGLNGGSGGGAGGFETGSTAAAGLGIALGNDGGTGASQAGGGGGGAGAQGSSASSGAGGNGGAGSANSITGSSVTRAGGGGGHGSTTRGSGGTGGGGDATTGNGDSGTTNTGGGGGGGVGTGNAGGPGGSGIVIVRVKV